jgi:calcium signal-modulating cyclophilin ligand
LINNGIYPDPEMERDVYEAPSSLAGFDPGNEDIFELLKTMQGSQMPQMSQPRAPPVPETPVSKFIRSKIPIVLIALTVYMLFAMNFDFVVGGAVFSSLIVWEIFEFFMATFVLKQPAQQGSLVNLLFVFSGVSQEKAQLILRLLGLVNKVIRDIAIFMFTFVMIHLAWSYLFVGESLTEILDKDFSNLLKNDEL